MKEKKLFSTYRSKRASQEIADAIKNAIFSKKIKIGEKLPSERALADQFGVGRMTIREALRTLETKGFLSIRTGCEGGAFVGESDPEAVAVTITDNFQLEGLTNEQMIEARLGLQCEIIKLAVKHATDDDLRIIEENVAESKDMLKAENPEEVVARMISFHILLAQATHNLPYIMFLRSLMEWARRRLEKWVPSAEDLNYSYESHERIFQAIKNRNVEIGQELMKEHIQHMGERVSAHVDV